PAPGSSEAGLAVLPLAVAVPAPEPDDDAATVLDGSSLPPLETMSRGPSAPHTKNPAPAASAKTASATGQARRRGVTSVGGGVTRAAPEPRRPGGRDDGAGKVPESWLSSSSPSISAPSSSSSGFRCPVAVTTSAVTRRDRSAKVSKRPR